MSPERWKQIEEVFQTALDTDPSERPRYLEESCAGDEDLRREVEALLVQYESAGEFIDEPVYEQSGLSSFNALSPFETNEIEPMVGQHIGVYRVVREVGRGGMGMVYLAERADNVFRRRVAIKLIKRGMDTDFILRRFRHERQILAALDHPYIARILDGGSTDDGRPYFVMEYIEGEPLYAFCDSRRLDVSARLDLFARICEAVDYAHQRQIIHRDLKPSNILVTKDGVPKLFDFGIGKLLDPELASDTAPMTATAMRLMTVEYASPEQVQGLPLTFASDVYSLGVLLYELVTGHRPYRFRNRSMHEMARVVVEEMPEQPSLAVSRAENPLPYSYVDSEALTIGHLAELRGVSPDGLRRELSGNLDNITMKALRKDAEQRYATAAALREDILRHLDGRPISAPFYFASAPTTRAASSEAQTSTAKSIAVLPLKLLRLGHAGKETTDGFLSIGLADALITRLSNARSLVVRPTSAVLRYNDETINPFQAGRELGVNFVLDGRIKIAGERIRVSLQLLDVWNETTVWANQFDADFTDALELEDAISKQVVEALIPRLTGEERENLDKRGTDDPQAFEAYLRGRYFWNQFTPESLPKALESFNSAVALDPNYALAYIGLADFYTWAAIYGLLPSLEAQQLAEQFARRAIELDEESGEAYCSLGLVMQNRCQWAEAKSFYERGLELSPNYVHAHEWYASWLVGTGNVEEGIAEIRRTEHLDPLSARTKTLAAWTLYQARRYDEALEIGRQIVELDKNYPQGYSQIGLNLLAMKRTEEALAAFRKFDSMVPDFALAKYQLCFALVAANRRDEAREVLADVEELARNGYVKPFFMAMAYAALDERDQAFRHFERALAEDDAWFLWFGTEPMLDPLRPDPRFIDLFRRTMNPLAEKQSAPVEQSNPAQPQTDSEKSIAVLPFKLIGAQPIDDTGDDYLSIGLADALINRLSNLRRLIVRPTSSILRLETNDPVAAGRELDVSFVIDGNIRRAGERIRVTAQLLNVRENSVNWSERFDERLTDVLELEDNISERVVKSLLSQLTGEEEQRLNKRGTDSPAAYQAYLRGRYFATQFSEDALLKSLEAYREAIRLDPNYALPHVGIAEFYVWTAIMGAIPTGEAYPQAKEELRQALAADEMCAEAVSLSAFIAMLYDWDWPEAERLIKRALDINPNYYAAHDAYAHILASQGKFDEAIAEIRRAEELDPLSPRSKIMVSCISYQARRFDLSAAKAEEAIKMEENSPQGFLHLGNALIHGTSDSRAIEALTVSVNAWGKTAMNKFMLCFALAARGQREEAEQVLNEILELARTQYVKSYFVAMAHVAMGMIDEAFEWFEKSIRERDDWMLWFGTDIKLDPLRSDARYFEILKKIGNPIIERQLPVVN